MEGQPLERVVNGRANVAERLLHEPIANRPQNVTEPSADQHQRDEQLHIECELERHRLLDVPAKTIDRVAENLGQRQFNRDDDEQQRNCERDLARILAQEGNHAEETAWFESRCFGLLISHRPDSFAAGSAWVKKNGETGSPGGSWKLFRHCRKALAWEQRSKRSV